MTAKKLSDNQPSRSAHADPPTPIRVTIIEDDRAVREGLGMLINGTPGYTCTSAYRSVEDALRSMGNPLPDLVLLDIQLSGLPGSEGARVLQEKYPQLAIIMLTVLAEQDKVFESICNGACGYLLKETPPAKRLEAIREAPAGGAPLSPKMVRKVVKLFQPTGPPEKFGE